MRAAICESGAFAPVAPPGGGPATAAIYKQLDRRLWELPGVYCLLWDPGAGSQSDIYVGSCRDFSTRLVGHDRKGWSHVIMLTGHGLGRGAAYQAEAAIGKVITGARPANRLNPAWSAHPFLLGEDMPWALLRPLVVLLNRCLAQLSIPVTLDPRVALL